MQKLGPGDKQHERVEWPIYLQNTSISLPAPLIPLLSSNAPPSLVDIKLVKDFKAGIVERISESRDIEEDIRTKIQELERELTEVKYSRRPLEKQAYACDVITSPFRHLPDDIIHEVFQRCPIYHRKRHFPSSLAQVCRHWHKLIHGTPSLWKELKLFWPRKDDPMTQFNRFAHLSRSMPFTLTLDGSASGKEDARCILLFLERLLSDEIFVDRLEALEVQGPLLYRVLQTLDRKRYPQLKSCLILPMEHNVIIEGEAKGEEEMLYDPYFAFNELFRYAPQLKQLWFAGRSMHTGTLIGYPEDFGCWSQLTTLHISGPIGVKQWHYLLKFCSNLQRARVPVTEQEADANSYLNLSQPYVHHHLQELIVTYEYHYDHILLAFAGFHFPKLHALQVEFLGESCLSLTDQATLIHSDFLNTFPSLETLVIKGSDEIDDGFGGIVPLLRVVPTIKSILFSCRGERMLQFLNCIQLPSETPLLPNLLDLELELLVPSAYAWSKMIEEQLTNALFDTSRARSLTLLPLNTPEHAQSVQVLHEMKLRYNPWVLHIQEDEYAETKSDVISYFWRLHHEVSLLDDVDITVDLNETDYSRHFATSLMRKFMDLFEFWRTTVDNQLSDSNPHLY